MIKLIIMTLILLIVIPASAEIPHLINYQGKLADDEGRPIATSTSVTFSLYTSASGGAAIWYETQSVTPGTGGIFNVLLGSSKDLDVLDFDVPYYLGIKVGTDAEMTPRQKIASAGYAFRAEKSEESNKVAGYEVSSSPAANKILALDSSAKFPQSALDLNVYDSGWFACSDKGTYVKTHNLGTTKLLIMFYWASDSSGTDMSIIKGAIHHGLSDEYSGNIQSITPTTLTVQAGQNGCHASLDDEGRNILRHSGYYRVIAIALE